MPAATAKAAPAAKHHAKQDAGIETERLDHLRIGFWRRDQPADLGALDDEHHRERQRDADRHQRCDRRDSPVQASARCWTTDSPARVSTSG